LHQRGSGARKPGTVAALVSARAGLNPNLVEAAFESMNRNERSGELQYFCPVLVSANERATTLDTKNNEKTRN